MIKQTINNTTFEYPEEILSDRRKVGYDPDDFNIKINNETIYLKDLSEFLDLLLNKRLGLDKIIAMQEPQQVRGCETCFHQFGAFCKNLTVNVCKDPLEKVKFKYWQPKPTVGGKDE